MNTTKRIAKAFGLVALCTLVVAVGVTIFPPAEEAQAAGIGVIESPPEDIVCDADGAEIKPTNAKHRVVFWSCQVDTAAANDAFFGGVGTTTSLYRARKAPGEETGSASAGGYCAASPSVTIHCGFGIVGH